MTAWNIPDIILPWRNIENNSYVIAGIKGSVPSEIDFNLAVTNHEPAGNKYYQMKNATANNQDKYISITTLGNPATETGRLELITLNTSGTGGTNIDYAEAIAGTALINTPVTLGYFHRNEMDISTLYVDTIWLNDPQKLMSGKAYQQDIEISFYHVFHQMNPVDGGKTNQVSIGRKIPFTIHATPISVLHVEELLKRVQNAQSTKYNPLPNSYNYIELSFPSVTFSSPDFSGNNLNYDMSWKIRNSYNNAMIE